MLVEVEGGVGSQQSIPRRIEEKRETRCHNSGKLPGMWSRQKGGGGGGRQTAKFPYWQISLKGSAVGIPNKMRGRNYWLQLQAF